jgi:hypothetical protein
MLSAQKEQLRLVASETSEDHLPNVGSFGKVVNSIQGLQQRLENFSAEDVGAAHDRTQTLLFRLAELQRKLTTCAAIKESMAAVRSSLDQMLTDCVDLGKIAALETPLSIQTLIHANKLIQFPRLNKLANVFAHQIAEDDKEKPTSRATVDDDCAQALQPSRNLDEHFDIQLPRNTDLAIFEPWSPPQQETQLAASVEKENSANAPFIPAVDDLPATTALDPIVELESTETTSEDPQAGNDDSQGPDSAPVDTAPSAANREKTQDALGGTTSTEFDQRLLDDLIRNYGEFTAGLSSYRTSETSDSADADQHGNEIKSEDLVQSIENAPERNNLPSIKKEGDLDRQLKKIIQDYGEYDLYSRQSSLNLKTGVVAAFLLLALILSGFYYFSPKTVDSQSSLTTSPAHTESSRTTEPKDSKNLTNKPGAPGADPDAPHAIDNSSRPKSKK